MKKHHIVLVHLLFWIAKLSPTFGWDKELWPLSVSFDLIAILVFYLNYLLVMPLLFARKRFGWAVVGWVALLFVFTFVRYGVEELLYPAWLGFRNYHPDTSLSYYILDNTLYYATPIVLFSGLLWLLAGYMRNLQENMALKQEKQQTELNFLKSQVNPHFLFNNLNSIYALVYQQSDKALPAIQKLSDMMRYMVSDATKDKIPLSRELQYVQDLIGLQELRVAGTAQVQLEVMGDVAGITIAPLLLIPFVENGFKHGDITDASAPFIIRVTATENVLELYTENKIAQGNKDTTSGIGLSNVQQRLELLFQGAYTLHFGDKGGMYICALKLKWSA